MPRDARLRYRFGGLLSTKPREAAIRGSCHKGRRSGPQRTQAESPLFDDRIAAEQARLSEPPDGCVESLTLERVLRWIDAQQHDARHCRTMPKHQIAEILVLRDKQSLFTQGVRHHIGIVRRGRCLSHVKNVVT